MEGQEQYENEKRPVGDFGEYLTPFLRAENVEDKKHFFDVVDAEEVIYDDTKKIRLHLLDNKEKYVLDLNKTNTVFLFNSGLKHPSDIIGKKISFQKVMAYSPSAKKEVESLRILKVEGIVKEEKVESS